MTRETADWTVYRVFFKGSPVPYDVETRSSWSIAKHRGMRLGGKLSKDFANIGPFANTMHLSGEKRPWDRGKRPANKEFVHPLATISNSESAMEANYWPADSIAGMFHRNIYHGTEATEDEDDYPQTVDGNAYRIYFKNCPATMDILAGGFVVTKQESFRMVIPGAETVVHRIDRGGGEMVYFYAYGGQFYPDEYNFSAGTSTRFFTYQLRYGLAGLMGSGGGGYPGLHTVDANLGTTASLDSAATFLPLDNVRAIVRLNSSDETTYSVNNNQVKIIEPTQDSSGLWTIFQPSAVGAALELDPPEPP